MTTKTITKSAICVALLAISSQITLTLGIIPFTLQLFTLSFFSYLLTKEEIILTLSTYIILGLLGLPIFAQMRGGLMMLTQPSVGFIFGFLPFTLLLKKHPVIAYLSLYIFGLLFLIGILKLIYHSTASIPFLIFQYAIMFIPTDLLSITFAKRLATKYHGHVTRI